MDQPTIAAGIAAASPGDTVEIACDTYNENGLVITSAITLKSATGLAECVMIDGDLMGRILHLYDADGAVIWGIKFADGYSADVGGGVRVDSCDVTFTNCIFYGSHADLEGGGLTLDGCASGAFDCTFTGNTALWGGAVAANYCSAPMLAGGCTFALNQISGTRGAGAGIAVNGGEPTQLVNCIVAFSTLGEAVYCEDGAAVTADGCVVFGNAGGDWVDCLFGQEALLYNSDEDPLFCDMLNRDFTLCSNSYCLPENNTPSVFIGAHRVGCDTCDSPVETSSWGSIKALFR